MAASVDSKDIYQGPVLDIDHHAGNETPTVPIPKFQVGSAFELDSAVVRGRSNPIDSSSPLYYLPF